MEFERDTAKKRSIAIEDLLKPAKETDLCCSDT